VVFVSLGGLLLLLGCLAALCCWHKKRKGRKTEREAEVLNFSDHVHVHKDTMPGPHGAKVVKLTVDEDVKFQEAVKTTGESSDTGAAGHHSSWHSHKKHHHGREDKESELINVTGHKHIEEKVVPGHHGDKTEILSEDEDIRFEAAEVSEESKAHIFKS
jgi:ABC-type nickel/cobalt efflux system permease component RcnA